MIFSITVLGSSSALPTSTRYPTAHLLNVNERFFLIDCGEGTQMQLRRYQIRFSKIDNIFISHAHGDHYYGLFGLLSSFSLLGRNKPLHLYAHTELEEIINFQFKNYILGYELIFHSINEKKHETIYQDKHLTVSSFPLKHRIPCSGFLFKERQKDKNIRKEFIPYYDLSLKDILKIKQGGDFVDSNGNRVANDKLTHPSAIPRSYAYCTDTSFLLSIVEYIKDVDLIYHESTFADDMKMNAELMGHSTAKQAAEIAKLASAKKLLLGHFSARYKDLSIFETESREIFPNSFVAKEGETYTIDIANEFK